MSAELEKWMFRDPAEIMDDVIRRRRIDKQRAERLRRNKSRRIQMLVKQVMRGR